MLGVIIGFLGVIVFAGSIPATSLAIEGFTPLFTTSARALIAGITGGAILLVLRRPFPQKHLKTLLTIAFLIAFFFPWMMALSLKEVGPAHGAVVLGLIPILSSSISVIITRTKPPLMFWIISALSGVIVTIFALHESGTGLALADIFMVIGAAATALGYNLATKLSEEMPSWEVIAWSVTIFIPASLIASLLTWEGLPQATPLTSTVMIWSGLFYLGVFSMLIGYILFTMGLKLGGVARIGQLQYLQVFLSLGMAAVINNDPLRLETVTTATLVTALVILAMRYKAKPISSK